MVRFLTSSGKCNGHSRRPHKPICKAAFFSIVMLLQNRLYSRSPTTGIARRLIIHAFQDIAIEFMYFFAPLYAICTIFLTCIHWRPAFRVHSVFYVKLHIRSYSSPESLFAESISFLILSTRLFSRKDMEGGGRI